MIAQSTEPPTKTGVCKGAIFQEDVISFQASGPLYIYERGLDLVCIKQDGLGRDSIFDILNTSKFDQAIFNNRPTRFALIRNLGDYTFNGKVVEIPVHSAMSGTAFFNENEQILYVSIPTNDVLEKPQPIIHYTKNNITIHEEDLGLLSIENDQDSLSGLIKTTEFSRVIIGQSPIRFFVIYDLGDYQFSGKEVHIYDGRVQQVVAYINEHNKTLYVHHPKEKATKDLTLNTKQ